MTPKEKAEEIFDKINVYIPINASFTDTGKEAFEKMKKDHLSTKKIATIVVDECLHTCVESMIYYWQEVKQEIEKL